MLGAGDRRRHPGERGLESWMRDPGTSVLALLHPASQMGFLAPPVQVHSLVWPGWLAGLALGLRRSGIAKL